MGKRYILDKDDLVFKKEPITIKSIIKRNYWLLLTGLIMGVIVWGTAYFNIIGSPKQFFLDARESNLLNKLSFVNTQFDSISNNLSRVQNRDDNFYRVISNLSPILPAIRQQGFGGINNYTNLEGYINSDLLIESNKRSEIIEKQLSFQIKSLDTIYRSVKSLNDSLLSTPAIAPMSPRSFFRISSPFGIRIHPISGQRMMHDGVDFAAKIGQNVYATGNGVVSIITRSSNGYGNRVTIKHGFGFQTVYAHLSTIQVQLGDTVYRGQKIGTSGNTGTSTGPHLHYEVIYGRHKQNPENFFINDLTSKEYVDMLNTFEKSY